MIELSEYKNAVISAIEKGSILHIDITATTTIGGVFPITNDDIHEDKFCIDRYVQTGDNIEIGTCAAAELTMELNNYSGRFNAKKFEGAELDVKVWLSEIKDSEGNPVKFPLGYFTVDEKPRMLDTVSISALDRMVQFDKPVDDSLTFGTITLYGIVVHCCNKCGVPLDDDSFNSNYPLGDRVAISKPEVDNLTYRNLIQYVAQLGLCCAYIGTDGKLKFGFYGDINTIPAFQLNQNNMFSHTIDEKRKGIACLTVKSGDKSATAAITESQQKDSVSYSLSINLEDVPLGETSANQEVVDTLFNKKILHKAESSGITENQFCFIPYSAQILPYFFLEPLDVIYLDDAKTDDMFKTVVAHTTFNLNQNMFIEAKSESTTKSGYATLNPLTAEEQRIINEIRKAAKDDTNKLRVELTSREQLLLDFNKALNSGSALYHNTVTTDSNGNPTGADYDVYTDSFRANTSTRFIVVSSAGVGWSDEPWKYGEKTADELPSVCKYFVSFDGTAVLSNLDSYRIRAELIECDDLQALHATIGGWNIIDNAIYSTYIDSNTGFKYNTYIQTPESTASYATGSYFIGVKNMSTGNYSFAVSPLGEIKAAGLVRSLSGFRCSSDFDGTNTVFEVDLKDTTKMKLYGNAMFSGNLSVAEVKATDKIRTTSGFRCSETFGGTNIFEVDVSGVSSDEPSIKMKVKGDANIEGTLRANDIWIRGTDGSLVSLKQKFGL